MTPDEQENGAVAAIPQFAPPVKAKTATPVESVAAPVAQSGPAAEVQAPSAPAKAAEMAAAPEAAVKAPSGAPVEAKAAVAPAAPPVSPSAPTGASAEAVPLVTPVVRTDLKALAPERLQALHALVEVAAQQARTGTELPKEVKAFLVAQAEKYGITPEDLESSLRDRVAGNEHQLAVQDALQDLRALFASSAPVKAPERAARPTDDPEGKKAAILGAAGSISAQKPAVDPEAEASIRAAMGRAATGAAVPTGGAAAVSDKTAGAVGTALGVVGGVARGVGAGVSKTVEDTVAGLGHVGTAAKSVATATADAVKNAGRVAGTVGEAALSATREAASGVGRGLFSHGVGRGVAVLPRLSEYRASQVEKTATAYLQAQDQFWQAGKMPALRKEIEERARVTGISVGDVMEKMRPNGEMADLHKRFSAAVSASPEAQTGKKAMDKALDSWVRQYGQAQKELLSPETHGNPHYDSLSDRLQKAQGKMNEATKKIPAFEGEQSHAERLAEAMKRIAEKIKEMLNALTGAFKREATNDGPAP